MSGFPSASAGLPDTHAANPANPAGTQSTALVMAGLGVLYTPSQGKAILARITGGAGVITGSAAVGILVAFGTGAAPANGAAATGTAIGVEQSFDIPTVSAFATVTFLVEGMAVGLAPGTQYWFDLQFATGNALDRVSLYNLNVVLQEVASS